MKDKILIALAGNPNSGKTTLFNAFTKAHHKVGNYPGVTVEKREGIVKRGGTAYHFVDLPGVYSLTAYSEDEVVARNFILNEKPDVIIDVLDSTNLERNLYLFLQLQELGVPIVGALNMSDEADKNKINIDEKKLLDKFGAPFVKIIAQHSKGLAGLYDAINQVVAEKPAEPVLAPKNIYDVEIEQKISDLQNIIQGNVKTTGLNLRWLAIKLLEKDADPLVLSQAGSDGFMIETESQKIINWMEDRFGGDSEIIISEQRYKYISEAVEYAVRASSKTNFSITKKLDNVFMNRFLALPLFAGILWCVFQITFTIGAYPQEWLETFFGFLTDAANNSMEDGLLRSLIVDGVIAGVGGVLSFLPLVVILFLLISILEDFGYISRAAYATDKLLHTVGLHGQSVFPMMLGFGCSIPAVMASRTLKSKRDRIITVLLTPMMSCGAKLPIHLMIAAAFFPENAGNMVMLIYLCGVFLAVCSAMLLRVTVLKGDPTPFVLELPPYRLPTISGVLWHVFEKSWSYVKKAGTIILATTILVWLITTFPAYELDGAQREEFVSTYLSENPEANDEELEGRLKTIEAKSGLENSYAGRIGKVIEPIFKPLGFNWQISIAVITGFAAKEVVVSTLGVLYSVGSEETEESEELHAVFAAESGLNKLGAFTFMLFMLLIPPCFAALAVIKAELGWKWLGFEFVFLTAFGWFVSFLVFQIGSLL
ncbi:MAG: ferrous iron transport protein B [Spirochaetaceae bacterium]|nr:ferrous iron transport protein B [Spirochaetaceae bacterium]